jgi:hypothetical protein
LKHVLENYPGSTSALSEEKASLDGPIGAGAMQALFASEAQAKPTAAGNRHLGLEMTKLHADTDDAAVAQNPLVGSSNGNQANSNSSSPTAVPAKRVLDIEEQCRDHMGPPRSIEGTGIAHGNAALPRPRASC